MPAPPAPPETIYSLDLDIGEVAHGYHLIVRSISLTDENLFFEYAFAPELAEEAEVWLNMSYDADISPADWDSSGAGYEEQYTRPPREARQAWFDFFRPDYVWEDHLDRHGQPTGDYLQNRIARLVFDLKTGDARIER